MAQVYIATISLFYQVVAVAETEEEARRLACEEGYSYLKSVHGDLGYTDPAYVAEYFGCTVQEFVVGSARLMT
ncbi:hypothetical protein PBI_MYXUS_80 [Mycobacterium phage Myxus]|uniref:Uncharacterized protein n=6 Tax=Fromanvirus packman TaxID=1034142 RepID=G1BR85_9CAUD|nr:hypothetical protein BJD80_gp029 [Mycobacterium phage Catalina]YP_009636049.1 hypothetical protein FGG56_gp24 [Mycobacterium phage PackMan]AMO43948.1 hypothetical protein PBI_MYXUS_80 [Mycobacterium phage Myxus]AOQ29037.1 hypothetical protein SEA_HORTUMSL17_81 [Mycobacterium phage HortumSL17]AOY12032.1 hypothetical protein SEA_PHAEDER_80 [Mycobacterium phage Phaeder]QDF20182.1 hypothetical protein SEA_TUBS_80 [Mycobacterium phage Tubs]AEK07351.1 hypothetical protein PACKMAN_79 [Mycobacteri